MRRFVLSTVVFVLAAALSIPALAGKKSKPPKKRKGDLVVGQVIDSETREPVPAVMIELYPVDPVGKRADAVIYTDLLGVDTTNLTGGFSIDVLSSPAALVEFGMLRGWSYEIVATAPGYYQFRQPAGEYKKGELQLTLELLEKRADVTDTTGVVEGEGKLMSTGKVVRGN